MPIIPVGAAVVTLDPGFEITVVNAAAAISTAQVPPFSASQPFTIQPRAAGGDRTLIVVAEGVFTVCTADLQISSDGGVTYTGNLLAANDFAANRMLKVQNLVPGLVYRWKIVTLTGTSVTLNAAVN